MESASTSGVVALMTSTFSIVSVGISPRNWVRVLGSPLAARVPLISTVEKAAGMPRRISCSLSTSSKTVAMPGSRLRKLPMLPLAMLPKASEVTTFFTLTASFCSTSAAALPSRVLPTVKASSL